MNKPINALIVFAIKLLIFLFLTGPLALCSQGQSTSVVAGSRTLAGKITSETNQPVIQATVSLLQIDSTLVQTSKSDSTGYFKLVNLSTKQYIIRITHVGKETIYHPTTISDSVETTLPVFTMATKAVNLAEISVKQKRPLVEVLGDRIILNVEDNPLFSGGTTLDLLGLAPHLSIDVINRKIGIDDKEGIILYQNNRQVYLPSDRIVPYLQSLPANSIARIEILTNPPARYDASSGGVVLLFTKDFYRQGTSVDLALTAGSGRYAKANASLALSIQKGKWEGKLLYTPNYRPVYYYWNSAQTLLPLKINSESGFSNGEQFNKVDNSAHLLRTNWDWKLSKSQTIGAVLFFNQISDTQTPTSTIEYRLAQPSARVTRLYSNSQLRSQQVNLSGNINYQYVFKNPQTTLSFDADLAHYTDNSRSKAEYSTSPNQLYPEQQLLINYPNDIRFKTVKADFTSPIGNKGDWEMGLKYSVITMSNKPLLLSATAGFDTLKSLLVRAFQYNEHTSAAYGSLSYQWEHLTLRAGLRMEHTNYVAQINGTQQINRNYRNLFPTLSLQYTTPQKYQYSLNANRRIVRPAFDILNPSYIFYNPITLYTGNPLLLPQLSNTFQVGVITPHRLSVTLSYNYSKNRITEILYRTDSISPTILNYYINFDWEKRYSVVMSLPVKINSYWQIQGTLTGLMSRFFSTFDNVAVLTTQPTGVVKLMNTFSAKKLSATLGFTYRNTAIIGYMKYKPLWYMDAGFQYAINQQSSLKLSATDLFHTLLLQNYGNYLNTSINFHHRSETQQILLTYTCRFGRTKARPVNERELGSESEQQRLGGNR